MSFPIAQLQQEWQVPDRVELSTDGVWLISASDSPDAHAPRVIRAYEGLLDEFLQLARGSNEQIRDFALDRGVLGFCEHGWPAEWDHRQVSGLSCGPIEAEPVARWRYLSEILGSLLEGAAAVEAGADLTRPVIEDLSQFQMLPAGVLPPPLGGSHKTGKQQHSRWILQTAANEFIGRAVRLEFSYRSPSTQRLDLRYRGRSLADALAVQTAMIIARAGSAYVCDGCGLIFVPDRVPRFGQDKFCRPCREAKVPQKRADARRRRKIREKRPEVGNG